MTLVMSARWPIKRLTICPLLQRTLVRRITPMSSHTSLDRSFPAALALASPTLGLCILTAPMLVAQPQRLISSRHRYGKHRSASHKQCANCRMNRLLVNLSLAKCLSRRSGA